MLGIRSTASGVIFFLVLLNRFAVRAGKAHGNDRPAPGNEVPHGKGDGRTAKLP
jgi:hypothetical protein